MIVWMTAMALFKSFLNRTSKSLQFYNVWARVHQLAIQPFETPPSSHIEATLTSEGLDRMQEHLGNLSRVDLTTKLQRHAAILVPLCHDEHGQPAVLFTLRSSKLRTHRGEVSFPGGHVDNDDDDAVAAALRECQEEVYLQPQRVLGLWHDVINKDGTAAVTPCVAYMGHVNASTQPFSSDEVEEVFTITLADLMNKELRSFGTLNRLPGIKMPQYDSGPHRVWGLTAYVLTGVLNSIVFPEFVVNSKL
eukprot:TRINITY_DN3684_c0_g1_i1.p1 TRINITY_DN3684_c0_g1~~TRINITY_DN3684_c0_g1_i1.p1  ORF type:complete len:249 (+),score=42.69 TRINITY_DN3684_c0_g1_i1:789-1535(+)